jgi:hypothetical protein
MSGNFENPVQSEGAINKNLTKYVYYESTSPSVTLGGESSNLAENHSDQ